MKLSSKTLQIRVEPDLLAAIRQQAEDMGYRSAPAYVRALLVAEVKQPSKVQTVELTRASKLALRYIELILAARSPQAENTDEALKYVRRNLAARSWMQQRQAMKI